LDYCLQLSVPLPHDLFQLYSLHASILQLCEGTSSLARFVLPPIADRQDTILWTQPLDELMQLPSGSE
jgi:hypothetical protein